VEFLTGLQNVTERPIIQVTCFIWC